MVKSKTKSKHYRKIGLFTHAWYGNLGNAATQDAVILHIKERCPKSQIVGFCMSPEETQKSVGIPCYPIRKYTIKFSKNPNANKQMDRSKSKLKSFLSKFPKSYGFGKNIYWSIRRTPKSVFDEIRFMTQSFKRMNDIDLFIISGGGQLSDLWQGVWSFPYTIFKWVILANIKRVPVYILNVGAGPLSHPLSKVFIKFIMRRIKYCSLRDEESRKFLLNLGCRVPMEVFPDSAYGLAEWCKKSNDTQKNSTPVVGLNLMPYCEPNVWPEKKRTAYEDYLSKMVAFGQWLIEKNYHIHLFASSINLDRIAINDFVDRLSRINRKIDSKSVKIVELSSVKDLFNKLSLMDFVVTSRFHPIIFASILNKPVLSVGYHGKINSIMANLNMSEYCLEIDGFDIESLQKRFRTLVASKRAIEEKISKQPQDYRKQLSLQFDRLFDCASGSSN